MSSVALPAAAPRRAAAERPIALWLLACCAMMFLIVMIGGVTRLTESGLSITEWQPVTGVLPPLGDAQWQGEFDKYKGIPQYRAIHADMTLGEFKLIFFWEYLHRLWARLIGVAFAAPFLYFLLRGRIPWRLAPPLAGLFALGALQGALGWYMVESGLSQRIEVSQYRLAAHLAMAVLIYAATLWVALDLLWPRAAPARNRRLAALRRGAGVVLGLVFLTLIAGAFVAGLRAGYLDNTFPLMQGSFVPPDYAPLAPWWRSWFEDPTTAQFDHRLLAEITWAAVVALWLYGLRLDLPPRARRALHALAALATLQAALGVATLLLVVPLSLALAHQAGALLLVTAALVARHTLRSESSVSVWAMNDEAEAKAKANAARWVSAIDQLCANPLAVVECPFCHSAPISVREIAYGLMPGMPIARLISCAQCHEHTTWVPYGPVPNDPSSNLRH